MSNFDWAPEQWQQAPAVPVWTEYFNQVNPNPAVMSDISNCVSSGQKNWGASFDDGPSPYTSDLVDFLSSLNMHATFYTTGSVVLDAPSALLHSYQSGNEISLHTWSHQDLTNLTDDEIVSELAYSAKAVYEVLGVVPKYFRPPYGEVNKNVRRVAASMGLTPVVWSVDTNDWQHVDQGQEVMDAAVTGEFSDWIAQGLEDQISLEHDMYPDTALAAQKAMSLLQANGYAVMSVAECIGDADPHGNEVLKAFFESGQFENKEEVVVGKPTTTSSSTTMAATTAIATTAIVAPTSTPAAPTTTSEVESTTAAPTTTSSAAATSTAESTPAAPTTTSSVAETSTNESIPAAQTTTSSVAEASTTESTPASPTTTTQASIITSAATTSSEVPILTSAAATNSEVTIPTSAATTSSEAPISTSAAATSFETPTVPTSTTTPTAASATPFETIATTTTTNMLVDSASKQSVFGAMLFILSIL
ncbi:chitin deacetylase [Podochytrium sp. JEL0797]|nr:chitin deacetylase [Podochytrium sp. JEL0797]